MGFDVKDAGESGSDSEQVKEDEQAPAFDKDEKEEANGLEKQIQDFVLKFTEEHAERVKKSIQEQKRELEMRIEKEIG